MSNGHLKDGRCSFLSISPCRDLCKKTTPAPQYGQIEHAAIAFYRRMAAATTATMITIAPTINQFRAVFRCLRRPIVLLLRVACGSLCCPSGLFFLLGFLRFRHGLPLCHKGYDRLWLLQSEPLPLAHAVMGRLHPMTPSP